MLFCVCGKHFENCYAKKKTNPTKQEEEVDLGLMQDNLPVTSRRQGQASPYSHAFVLLTLWNKGKSLSKELIVQTKDARMILYH